jgi:predicted Ser/Thr protein kinase
LRVIRELERILKEERSFFKHLEIEEKLRKLADDKEFYIGQFYDSDLAFSLVVNEHYKKAIAREVKFAFIGLREEDLDQRVQSYIENIEKQMIHGVGKPIEGKIQHEYIEYVESLVISSTLKMFGIDDEFEDISIEDVDEDVLQEFRESIISSIAEYDNINPDAKGKRDLRKALPSLYSMLEKALYKEKEKQLDMVQIQRGLEIMDTPHYETFDQQSKDKIEDILSIMKSRYGYCDTCARAITLYAIKEGILDDEYYDYI